jgi:hypothetical protein
LDKNVTAHQFPIPHTEAQLGHHTRYNIYIYIKKVKHVLTTPELPPSSNVCHTLVHFILKNHKHLETVGVFSKDVDCLDFPAVNQVSKGLFGFTFFQILGEETQESRQRLQFFVASPGHSFVRPLLLQLKHKNKKRSQNHDSWRLAFHPSAKSNRP